MSSEACCHSFDLSLLPPIIKRFLAIRYRTHLVSNTTSPNGIPICYKRCHTFSDFWDAYAKVFPKATHRSVGKDAGQTCHMVRNLELKGQRICQLTGKNLL
jgi:hypothetical protein